MASHRDTMSFLNTSQQIMNDHLEDDSIMISNPINFLKQEQALATPHKIHKILQGMKFNDNDYNCLICKSVIF
jgi:hypothetical protein